MIFGKRALQTRHDQVLRDYDNRTAELEKAYKRIEQLTAQVGTETEARVAETQARGMLLDFTQEVMTFLDKMPISLNRKDGLVLRADRDSLVSRAKANRWYREPGEQEAEQVTE